MACNNCNRLTAACSVDSTESRATLVFQPRKNKFYLDCFDHTTDDGYSVSTGFIFCPYCGRKLSTGGDNIGREQTSREETPRAEGEAE